MLSNSILEGNILMSQSKRLDAIQKYIPDCGYHEEDKFCHFCGTELESLFGPIFYDTKSGICIQYMHKRCMKTKTFLFWEIYTCPTNSYYN